MGRTPQGYHTGRWRCARSRVRPQPGFFALISATISKHVAALSDALSAFGRAARITIAEMDELEDSGSADMLTEISRGLDKWLWFVEAHLQT